MADIKIIYDEGVFCPKCGQRYEPHPQLNIVELEKLKKEPVPKPGLVCIRCHHNFSVVYFLPTKEEIRRHKILALCDVIEAAETAATEGPWTTGDNKKCISEQPHEVRAPIKGKTYSRVIISGNQNFYPRACLDAKSVVTLHTAAPELARLVREALKDE